MAFAYPLAVDSPRKRIQFCLRFQEVLRRVHNGFGKWYNTGITQTQYDNATHALAHFLKVCEYSGQTVASLETIIRNKYPYVAQISETVWKKFITEDFKPRQTVLSSKIPLLRLTLRELLEWSEQIDEI